jgi:hypothetical protein
MNAYICKGNPMSEQEFEESNVPISPERLIAAILKKYEEVELSVDELLDDYSNYQIAISQENSDYVIFSLVEGQYEES